MISSRWAGTLGLGATGRPWAANQAANIWGTGERDAERLILNICQLRNNFKANLAGHLLCLWEGRHPESPQHMHPPATADSGFIQGEDKHKKLNLKQWLVCHINLWETHIFTAGTWSQTVCTEMPEMFMCICVSSNGETIVDWQQDLVIIGELLCCTVSSLWKSRRQENKERRVCVSHGNQLIFLWIRLVFQP